MHRIAWLLVVLFAATWTLAAQDKTVIHVINVQWKADADANAVQAAVEKAKALPKAYPGILKVWTVKIKNQVPETDQQIVMQFRDAAALKEYAGSKAQKDWYEVYMPVRGRSMTCDISE